MRSKAGSGTISHSSKGPVDAIPGIVGSQFVRLRRTTQSGSLVAAHESADLRRLEVSSLFDGVPIRSARTLLGTYLLSIRA
jgi:hypothetical protein